MFASIYIKSTSRHEAGMYIPNVIDKKFYEFLNLRMHKTIRIVHTTNYSRSVFILQSMATWRRYAVLRSNSDEKNALLNRKKNTVDASYNIPIKNSVFIYSTHIPCYSIIPILAICSYCMQSI